MRIIIMTGGEITYAAGAGNKGVLAPHRPPRV